MALGQVPIKNRLSLLDGDFGGEVDPPTAQGFGNRRCELRNRSPTSTTEGIVPEPRRCSRPETYAALRDWGCASQFGVDSELTSS
jgi:hypothetical protein